MPVSSIEDYAYRVPFDEDNPNKYVNATDYLFKDAQFGIEVENFLQTQIGKYLKEKLEQKIRTGVDEVLSVADHTYGGPTDPTALNMLRMAYYKIDMAREMMGWIAEAVVIGKQSYQELKNREEV